jgi:tetratricopeptide (TPR) repeat protein
VNKIYRVRLKTLIEVVESSVEEGQKGERTAEDLSEDFESLRTLGAEALSSRDYSKAALLYRAAWERAQNEETSAEQNSRVGQARHDLVIALRLAKRWDLARQEAEAALEQPGLPDLILDKLRLDLAMIYWRLGRPLLATELFDRLLTRSADVTPEILAVTLHERGSMLLVLGHAREAAVQYRRALDVQKKRKDLAGVAKLHCNIGLAELEAGNHHRAARSFLRAIPMAERVRRTLAAERLRLAKTIGFCKFGLARIHFEKGENKAARSAFREVSDQARLHNDYDLLFASHYYLRRIALAEGQLQEARSCEASLRFFASRLEEPLPELEDYRRECPNEPLPDFPSTYQSFFRRS